MFRSYSSHVAGAPPMARPTSGRPSARYHVHSRTGLSTPSRRAGSPPIAAAISAAVNSSHPAVGGAAATMFVAGGSPSGGSAELSGASPEHPPAAPTSSAMHACRGIPSDGVVAWSASPFVIVDGAPPGLPAPGRLRGGSPGRHCPQGELGREIGSRISQRRMNPSESGARTGEAGRLEGRRGRTRGGILGAESRRRQRTGGGRRDHQRRGERSRNRHGQRAAASHALRHGSRSSQR